VTTTQIDFFIQQAARLIEQDKPLHAIQYYKRLQMAAPESGYAYFELASIYMSLNRQKLAEKTLRESVKATKSSPEALVELGNFYLKQEKFGEAIACYEKVPVSAKIPQVHYNLGIAAFALSDYDRAEREFKITLAFEPQFPRIKEVLKMVAERKR
jgi:tetratricopeptide (TPR) repeat protein